MHRLAPRAFAAWSLWIVMALVVTPRAFFHHCGEGDGHAELAGGSTLTTACAACEGVWLLVGVEAVRAPEACIQHLSLEPVRRLSMPELVPEQGSSDRGPPVAA